LRDITLRIFDRRDLVRRERKLIGAGTSINYNVHVNDSDSGIAAIGGVSRVEMPFVLG
jgi:hypothetical protein